MKAILRLALTDPESFRLRLRSRKRDPLFVFQFGKVASRTVATTLEPFYYVRHSHLGSEFSGQLQALGMKPGDGFKGAPVPLVSITREPIAREISSFFQNVCNPGHKYHFGSRAEVMSADPEQLVEFFLRDLDANLEYILGWFGRSFKAATGVDVYRQPFDPDIGWQRFEDGGFQVLLLRFEDLKRNFVPAINSLLANRREGAVEVEALTSRNVSGDKWYREQLDAVRAALSFDGDFLDRVYGSQYCRHFYSPAELEDFRARWLKS